jgi:MFS family permease
MTAALAGYFLFAVGYIVYLTFLIAWMRAEGASAALIATTWAVLGIAVMASPFPWRKVLASSNGGAALSLSCIFTGVGTLLPVVLGGPVGVILSAILFGLSFFIAPSAVTSFSRKNLTEAQWGTAVALFTTLFAVGQMIGPIAAGIVADLTNNIGLGLLGAGLIMLLAAVVAIAQKPLVQNP